MNELENLQITEISLCGEGKNPGAAITLIKAKEEVKSADSSGDLNKSKLEVTKGMDTVVNTYDQAALDKAVEEAVQKAVAPKDVEVKKLSILAKMTDIEKAYYGSLDQEDQILFLNKSTDERVSLAKAHHVEDEVFTIEGTTISKAKVGKEAFDLLKAQITEKENLQYVAKANKEFANLPGTSEEKAKVLKGIDSIQDVALRKAVYDAFEKASAAYNTGLFTEIGEIGENITKAADATNLNNLGTIDTPDKAEKALDILAKAYQKSCFTEKGEQVSISKAYSVIMDTEEGQKLYSLSRLNPKFKR